MEKLSGLPPEGGETRVESMVNVSVLSRRELLVEVAEEVRAVVEADAAPRSPLAPPVRNAGARAGATAASERETC